MKQFIEAPDFLQKVIDEAEKNNVEARRLAGELSEQQLNWTSNPDKWSIAQCLDHLAVTGAAFDKYYTDAIALGREKWPVREAVQYRPTLVGGWLLRQVTPEKKRGFPAPKVFRPSQSNISGSLEKYLKQQEVFLDFVRAAAGLDYNSIRLRSPVTPLMRYSIADAFVVTVLHGQRHLGQARRMLETEGFPE
ncbi:MAG TPA: DinB family protein [Pyrinomonadaceae bacterium]|nr:DinB family protein [Pyrinomonadaceae bacterium]